MLLVMLVMRRILVKHAVNNEIATAYWYGVLCLFPLNVHIQRWVNLVFYTIQFNFHCLNGVCILLTIIYTLIQSHISWTADPVMILLEIYPCCNRCTS